MIQNAKQYRVTWAALTAFVQGLHHVTKQPPSGSDVLWQAYIEGMWSVVDDLIRDLEDYERRREKPVS